MAAITVAMRTEISQLYVSLFGRAPDSDGLGFWVRSYAGGGTLAEIATAMYQTQPARDYYPFYATPSEIVTTFYTNVLGRAPDAEGLAFWVKEFNSVATPGTFFAKLVSNVVNYNGTDAAGLESQSLFINKVAVAQFYGENDGTVAGATAALSGVTSAASTVDAAKAAILNPTPVVVAGQTFTLTTSVDAVSGGAGDDTISGLLGTSGTYTVGDNIMGGAGTDTLNLIAVTGTDADGGLISVNGVESINIRVLATAYGSAGDQVSMNAADWVGVTTLSNASSLVNTQLDVSGLTDDTTIVLNGNTDINVAFNNTATGATANAVLVNAGSAGTATTIASASATNTANFDFDQGDTGFVTNVNLEVRGTLNLARIEAGSNATTYTVTGTGNAALVTDDTITSFDASAAAGAIDITFSGISDVVAKGGAGGDTFRLGTTISNGDSFNGGEGTDTIAYTQGDFGRDLNTTSVEIATITFASANAGSVNASGSTVTTYNVYAGAASADATINSIANAATVNLTVTAAGLDTVTLDAVSGAASMTINVGTAGGAGGVDGLVVSDVAAVTINATTGTAGSFTISTSTFDADVKSITVNTLAGESDLTIADFNAAGVTALSINANGSAGIAFTSGIDGAALVTLTAIASGEGADIGFDTIGTSASALATTNLTFDGRASADITIGAISLGNGVTAAAAGTIVMNAGNGSNVGSSGTDVTFTGAYTLTLDLNADASGDVDVGHVIVGDGSAGTAQSTAQVINIEAMSIGANGSVGIEAILATAATAGVQINIGTITIGSTGGFALTSGILSMTGSTAATDGGATDLDVSSITVDLGTGASATFGAISTTAGAVGAITVTTVGSGSGTFGAINASSIGAITITTNAGSAGTGEVDFAGFTAVSNIGAITLSLAGNGDVTIAAISAGGDIGTIEIGVATGATANFDTIDASSIGAIAISGAGFVDFGTVSAAAVGSINASNQTSGTFTIDLSGVVARTEITVGGATNTIIGTDGNDVITLKTGSTANDFIQYATALGTDEVNGFGAGTTAGDQIEIYVSAMAAGQSGGLRNLDGVALSTATTVDISALVTAGTATVLAADNILVLGTGFASAGSMLTFMKTGLIAGTAALAGSGALVVVWTDSVAKDSYVSLVNFDVASAQAGGTTGSLASATLSIQTLVTLVNASPGALVAANFDLI